MKFDPIKNDFQDKFGVALDVDSAKTGFPFIFIKKTQISPRLGCLCIQSNSFREFQKHTIGTL